MAKIIATPWSNVDCEKDIINAMAWNQWILRILGIWPLVYADTTTIEKILAIISFALCWFLIGFLMIPMSIYILSDEAAMYYRVKTIGPLSYVFSIVLKYFFLVFHHRDIQKCINALIIDWRAIQKQHHRQIMINGVAKSHLLSKFCVMFMYCGGLSYITAMPFLSRRPEDEKNVTLGPLPYFGYEVFFNLRLTPVYLFVYCTQWCSTVVLYNVTTAVCCLMAMFVFHICSQIEIVMLRVENLVEDLQNDRVISEESMAIIVTQHIQALKFSASIENIFSELCLIEVVGSSLIICLLEYYCIVEWKNNDSIAIFTYFFLLISFVLNVFIFCYISELLTDQCSKVGQIAYKTGWYHLPGKRALDLTLMINMSHHPIRITAGKIINLSFSSFGNVLKTSIAYLNLLRTFI